MRKITIALLIASLLSLLVTGCDMESASSELHGKWIAYGGLSLEFTTGRYTKVLPYGDVQKGTYKTDGEYIYFYRTEYSSEKFQYTLEHPVLTVDGVPYYFDAPRVPHDLESVWHGFMGENATSYWHSFKLSKAKPTKDDQWVHEGKFEFFYLVRGDYIINRRNFPDAGKMVFTTTHMHGRFLFYYITIVMPAYLRVYFDIDKLAVPEYSDDWWFTTKEATQFYIDAMQRAGGNLLHVEAIRNRMYVPLESMGMEDVDVYEYTIEVFDKPFWDFNGYELGPDTVLTIKTEYGQIATFVTGAFINYDNYGSFGFSMNSTIYTPNTSCECVSPIWARSCLHREGL